MATNPVEPDLALHQSFPNLLRTKASQTFSGTFSGNLWTWSGSAPKPPRPFPKPSPEPCCTWAGSAPKPPRPSPEPCPEPCWTWPGSTPKPPKPSPEPSPEPCCLTWLGTKASRNLLRNLLRNPAAWPGSAPKPPGTFSGGFVFFASVSGVFCYGGQVGVFCVGYAPVFSASVPRCFLRRPRVFIALATGVFCDGGVFCAGKRCFLPR